jgi:hypothetical protein
MEPWGAQFEARARELARGRRQARRFGAVIGSGIFGSAFLLFAVRNAFDGDWRNARDVGLLGLLCGLPAIVAVVRGWREPTDRAPRRN